jgi:hypothetical protein
MECSFEAQQKKISLRPRWQKDYECEISGKSEPAAFAFLRASHFRATLEAALFSLICLLFTCHCFRAAQASLPEGSGSFLWEDKTGASDPDKSLKVYYYRPSVVSATTPVWFIMHGTERNADEYRDYFVKYAAEQGAFIVAPKFDAENWPGTTGYNLGNISKSATDLTAQAERDWSFSKIEPLFDFITKVLEPSIAVESYSMFGHSAGAHFVHRFLMWKPQARVNLAIAANAGWYTLPHLRYARYEHDWPYSLSNVPLDRESIRPEKNFPSANIDSAFLRRMVVLLGDQDLHRDEYLSTAQAAEAQGTNRFQRGQFFFSKAESEAAARGVDFEWALQIVPGAGHSASQMAIPAAELLRYAEVSADEFRKKCQEAIPPVKKEQ